MDEDYEDCPSVEEQYNAERRESLVAWLDRQDAMEEHLDPRDAEDTD